MKLQVIMCCFYPFSATHTVFLGPSGDSGDGGSSFQLFRPVFIRSPLCARWWVCAGGKLVVQSGHKKIYIFFSIIVSFFFCCFPKIVFAELLWKTCENRQTPLISDLSNLWIVSSVFLRCNSRPTHVAVFCWHWALFRPKPDLSFPIMRPVRCKHR